MNSVINRRLGRFTVEKLIGKGGFSTVYKVYDPTVSQVRAIKLLLSEWLTNKTVTEMFLVEGQTTMKLSHNNLVEVVEVGKLFGQPYHLMEYCEGLPLSEFLADPSLTLSAQEICLIIEQTSDVIEYLHKQKLIHRDIKPQNIIINEELRVKLLDLGIAVEMMGFGLRATQVIGTAKYMAPEQKKGKKVSPQTDMFAFACVCEEILLRYKLLTEDSKTLISTALKDDPSKRPISISLFARQLCTSIK